MKKASVYSLKFPDKWALYQSWMPWFKNGGFFIPSKTPAKMGEDILLLVRIPDQERHFALQGKVAWISIDGSNGKKPGFGIHLEARPESKDIEGFVETMVAGWNKSDKPTLVL